MAFDLSKRINKWLLSINEKEKKWLLSKKKKERKQRKEMAFECSLK
jgi:ribosomal protein S1